MLSSITEVVLGQVVGCSTSAETWAALERLYASPSKAHVLQLKIQLQSTKKGAMAVTNHVSKMKTSSDNLSAAGAPIADDDLAMYILAGVGSEYDPVVVGITSRPEAFTLQDVCSMLLSQKARIEYLNSCAQIELPNASANIAATGQKENHGFTSFSAPNTVKPYNGGHGSNNNNSRSRGRGSRGGQGRGNGSRPACLVCGKQGHIAINCYHRFDRAYQSPQANQIAAMIATP